MKGRVGLALVWVCGCAALAAAGCEPSVIYIEAPTTAVTTSSTGGAGGAMPCTPGATRACYSGPAGTEGHGICRPGEQSCAANGEGWGSCEGEVLPQPENCATPLDEDCDGLAAPCVGTLLWAKSFGGTGNQRAAGIAVDAAGNVVVVGTFADSVDFGGGPLVAAGGLDVFVVKLDHSGNHVWSKAFGADGDEGATTIAVDGFGDILLAGLFASSVDFGGGPLVSVTGRDAFVAKLDSTGAHVWSKGLGISTFQSHAPALAVDGSGYAVLTGSFIGSADFGGGPLISADHDAYVLKLDPTGKHVWSKTAGEEKYQEGASVGINQSGDVFLLGDFGGVIDLGGGALPSASGIDGFLATLDGAGHHTWSKSFGLAAQFNLQYSTSIAVGGGGDIVVTGYFGSEIDLGGGPLTSNAQAAIFLAKLDDAGSHIWSKSFGEIGIQSASSTAIDGLGNIVLTGGFGAQLDFGGGPIAEAGNGDVFLARFGADGSHLWSKRFGDAQGQWGVGVAADASGNAFLTGNFAGTIDLGSGISLDSAGEDDIFIAAFGP